MSEDKDKKILDSDADGLLNSEEEALGTDPYSKDTDKDGLDDYQEVKVYKTDPLNPDTDFDSVSDGIEVKIGLNPKGPGKLKDLFIPHEGNGYKPHALHPKRLAFHAVSAIVIKVIMVAFALSLPVQAWLSPDVLHQQAQKIIELTNNVRVELGINPLTESQKLNQAALNKAQDMLIQEYFAHVGPDDRALRHWLYDMNYSFRVAGENLAMGFSQAEQVVAAWKESPTHYSNLIDPDFTQIGVGVVSGEYNDHDTTLVAQYFGEPYNTPIPVEAVPEPKIKEELAKQKDYNSKVEQAIEPFSEPQNSQNQATVPEDSVLSEKDLLSEVLPEAEAIVLERPILISPENNYIAEKDLNILTVSAKGAERISVYSNNQSIANKVVDNEQFDIAVKLSAGNNNIQIVAYRGEENLSSDHYLITVDNLAPIVDQEKTSILVNKPSSSDDIVLKATAYLSPDTKEAQVSFAGHQIDLEKDNGDDNKWTGYTIISDVDYDTLFNPLTLATLTAKDQIGNTLTQDIKWEEIKPVVGSTVNRYSFLKQSNSEFVAPLFNIGQTYYQIILVIVFIALLLNIFIKIKKQHTSTIASTVGLMLLLIALTIF